MNRRRPMTGGQPKTRCGAHLVRPKVLVAGVLVALLGTGASGLAAQATPPDTVVADTLQRPPVLLEPIEVNVARERSAPPPVTAITVDPERVRSSQASDPYLMLRDVAGIEVHDQGQGPGFASNVVMRGFTSDHSADVLLVIDGVPVNLPAHGHVEGFADWNVLMPGSVSSLRVIKGNGSPLYGDFALAGAVEVFTRADAEGGEAYLGSSQWGDVRGGVSTGRRAENHGFFVSAEGRRQEGWRENDDYWLANGLVRGWRALGGGRLEGGLSIYSTEWNSPGFLSIPDFNAQRLEQAVDDSDGGRSRRAMLSGRWSFPISADQNLQVTGWGMASDYELFLNIPGHAHDGAEGQVVQSGEWDSRLGAGGRVEYGRLHDGGDVTLGVSGRFDDVRYEHAATFRRSPINPEIDLDATHAAGAVYGRWRQSFGDRLAVDAGLRLDIVRHASTPRLVDGQLTAGAPQTAATNAVLGPKLGLRYALADDLSLRASSARGFRSPVGIIGDPTRDPYLSWSHEVGLTREFENVEVDLALFRVDVDNERVQDPVTLLSSGAGSSVRQGVDTHVTARLSDRIGLEFGGTWNHARLSAPYVDAHDDHVHDVFAGSPLEVTTETGESDLRVPGVADFSAHIRGDVGIREDLAGWVSWEAVGPHLPIGEPGLDTQAYSLLDLGVSWQLGAGRTLDVEIANLLDIRYVELRSSAFVTPGLPRSIRVQMRVEDLPF